MDIILMSGPPRSGKSTFAKRVGMKFEYPEEFIAKYN